eukprot:3749124-Amphidinium_carterae.1
MPCLASFKTGKRMCTQRVPSLRESLLNSITAQQKLPALAPSLAAAHSVAAGVWHAAGKNGLLSLPLCPQPPQPPSATLTKSQLSRWSARRAVWPELLLAVHFLSAQPARHDLAS